MDKREGSKHGLANKSTNKSRLPAEVKAGAAGKVPSGCRKTVRGYRNPSLGARQGFPTPNKETALRFQLWCAAFNQKSHVTLQEELLGPRLQVPAVTNLPLPLG